MHRTAALAAALLLAACSGSGTYGDSPSSSSSATAPPAGVRVPGKQMIGTTLATVSGHPIGSKEFDPQAVRRAGPAGDIPMEVRMEVLDDLVDEKLLYIEALRRDLDLDPKIQKMMVNTLLKEEVYSSVRTSDIGEDELRAYFEQHKSEFVVPAKKQLKRILIKPRGEETPELAQARAAEVRAEVVAHPGDFKALAQQHSQGPFARRGGDMGWVTEEGKPGVDPAVVAKGFTLDRGDVSEVFETRDGWNIVQVADDRAAVERTFEQMRGSVLRKVKSERYRTLYESYVAGLRAKAKVDVDRAALERHTIDAVRPLHIGASTSPGARPGDDVGPEGEVEDLPEGSDEENE
jgi:parvulin-like peptidyl-prolyl isomerase